MNWIPEGEWPVLLCYTLALRCIAAPADLSCVYRWQRVDKRSLCEAELVFTNGQRRFGWSKLARHHIPNHLFEERKVADKSTLADHLALMREEGTRTPFWPETYWLRDVVDRAVFLKVLEADPTPQPPFLIKDPTQHRGRGVRFLEDKDVEKVMERLATKTPDQDKHGHDIVQRYVPNPLLLPPHGRKFDLRVYWLIASTNPVRVYYHDGTTRSSLESFDPDNMEDMGQHLTNGVSLQCSSILSSKVCSRSCRLHCLVAFSCRAKAEQGTLRVVKGRTAPGLRPAVGHSESNVPVPSGSDRRCSCPDPSRYCHCLLVRQGAAV